MRKPSRLVAVCVLAAGLVLAAGGAASADATATGSVENSPGFLSGNLVQVPIDVSVNACGNSVNLVGLGNPAFGNRCENGEEVTGDDEGMEHHAVVWHHHWWGDNDDNMGTDDDNQDCD